MSQKVQAVNKVQEGRPHIVDMLKNREVSLIVNTVEEDRRSIQDSWSIRNTALQNRITWAQYNMVTDASFNEFQMIVCQRALPDFGPLLRQRVLRLFHDSLSLFGVLGLIDVKGVVPADEEPGDAVPRREGQQDEQSDVVHVLEPEPPLREIRDARHAMPGEDPQRVKVPDYAHLLPEPIRRSSASRSWP